MVPDGSGQELQQTLTEAGFDVSPERPGELEAFVAAEAAAHDRVLEESWNLAETARRLGTSAREIRQLVAEGVLYGFKERGQWRIPRFQFMADTLLPGIDHLVGALDPELGPVSVQRFATLPNEELLVDGVPLSPVEWLAAGHDPAVVARIAAGLASG